MCTKTYSNCTTIENAVNGALLRRRVEAGEQNGKALRDFSDANIEKDKKAAAEDIRAEGRELKRDIELVEHDVWDSIDEIISAARTAKQRASLRLVRVQDALAFSCRTIMRYRKELDADREFLMLARFPVPSGEVSDGVGVVVSSGEQSTTNVILHDEAQVVAGIMGVVSCLIIGQTTCSFKLNDVESLTLITSAD